jgi:hypothetical protein
MYDLQRAGFLHCSIRRLAVGAVDNFARGGVDDFAEDLALEVLEVWSTEFLEECSTVKFGEEDASATL